MEGRGRKMSDEVVVKTSLLCYRRKDVAVFAQIVGCSNRAAHGVSITRYLHIRKIEGKRAK